MGRVNLPGGGTVFHIGSEEETEHVQKIVEGRHAFAIAYCKLKGWPEDPEKLTIAQIMEIRDQDGWKNPVRGEN